jgi:hypothetical protein
VTDDLRRNSRPGTGMARPRPNAYDLLGMALGRGRRRRQAFPLLGLQPLRLSNTVGPQRRGLDVSDQKSEVKVRRTNFQEPSFLVKTSS